MEESYPTEFSDPIVVGPNGSGSKGSGVSQDAYAQSADTYGYQGSYNSQNGSKQSEAELSGNSSSSNWSGGGGCGGRGGGGGGGGGEAGADGYLVRATVRAGISLNQTNIPMHNLITSGFGLVYALSQMYLKCSLLTFPSVTVPNTPE